MFEVIALVVVVLAGAYILYTRFQKKDNKGGISGPGMPDLPVVDTNPREQDAKEQALQRMTKAQLVEILNSLNADIPTDGLTKPTLIKLILGNGY